MAASSEISDAERVCAADPSEAVLSALVTRLGYGTVALFSFTAIGIPVWLIGACYLLIAGRCLPDRGDQSDDILQVLSRDGYLTEMVIPQGSPLCETTLRESRLQRRFDVDVLDVHRDVQRLQPPGDPGLLDLLPR